MPDGMEEIIDEFVTEAEESLERIDPLFVELETRKTADRDILDDLFRSMHTIKGAAGFLGFHSIVDVAHRAEGIMKKLRDREAPITTDVISVILKSVDMLKAIFFHIKTRDGVEEDLAPLLEEMDEALKEMSPEDEYAEAGEAEEEAGAIPVSPLTEEAASEEEAEAIAVTPLPEEKWRGEAAVQAGQAPAWDAKSEDASSMQAVHGIAAQMDSIQQTLRVDVGRIDKVMNLTGEIVLVRNRLLNISNYLDSKYSGDAHVEGLQEAVSFLDLVTSDIQLAVMKMRMQPIKKVFSKFPRLVRDLSQSLGKEVDLNISGENTEVDRTVIERLGDPLVHIIRNCIDHGLEPGSERAKKGKPLKGMVDISAFRMGNQIVIEVADDGRGINVGKIRERALLNGVVTSEEAKKMDDRDLINLIFLPGFSTVTHATELSGRGVGMDVVKTNISKLNGFIEIYTTPDVGTTFRISIPLTLAIIQALMVRTGGVQYAIPLAPIEETIKVAVSEVDRVTGRDVLAIRGRVHPFSELGELIGVGEASERKDRYVLVIAIGDKKFCVGVDELLGQEEVVIKSIEGINTESTGILGATITGEGKIVLILDPSSMSKNFSKVT